MFSQYIYQSMNEWDLSAFQFIGLNIHMFKVILVKSTRYGIRETRIRLFQFSACLSSFLISNLVLAVPFPYISRQHPQLVILFRVSISVSFLLPSQLLLQLLPEYPLLQLLLSMGCFHYIPNCFLYYRSCFQSLCYVSCSLPELLLEFLNSILSCSSIASTTGL